MPGGISLSGRHSSDKDNPGQASFRMLTLRLLASLLFIALSLPAFAQKQALTADDAFQLSVERGEDADVLLRWTIADGYYLYRNHLEANEAATGKAVQLQTDPGTMEAADASFGPSEVYYREVIARLGGDAPQHVAITYQGCKKDSICYPPLTVSLDTQNLRVSKAAIGFNVSLTPAASSEAGEKHSFTLAGQVSVVGSLLASGGALWVIVSFLAFGLLLSLTPCVLPMYPILSAMLAREGEALTPRRGLILSSVYVLAMATAFGMLGIVAAWSGQNLQMAMQSPVIIAAVSVLFVILSLSMFGLFELQLPSTWINRIAGVKTGMRGSLGGAAGMGFLSALIVGPCVTAPLAAALLYIAQTGDAYLGAAALFALGFGQGIPLIALGAFGSKALPRAGLWMVQIKYVFGFVFLGVAIWMASRLLPPEATMALWAILLLTAAIFMGAADRLPTDASAGPRLRKTAGLVLSLGGVILAIGAASGGTDPLRPLAHLRAEALDNQQPEGNVPSTALTFTQAGSTPDIEHALASANGHPTMIYVTADWCVVCKAIERDVLPNADVIAGLNGFQRLKVDLTTLDPANKALMHDLAVIGPPTMIFFNRHAAEADGSRLIGDITTASLQASIAQARQ